MENSEQVVSAKWRAAYTYAPVAHVVRPGTEHAPQPLCARREFDRILRVRVNVWVNHISGARALCKRCVRIVEGGVA